MAQFVKTPKGICMVSPIMGEFTICGDAFDLVSDVPGYEWKETNSTTVTCPDCAHVVKECQGIKTRISR